MKKILVIFLKELKDSLRDRRTLMMMIVFPLLLMYGLMSVMVGLQSRQHKKAEEKILNVGLVTNGNAGEFKSTLLKRTDMKIIENPDLKNIEELLTKGTLDFAIEFESGFDKNVADKKTGSVNVYLKSSSEVRITKERITGLLKEYKENLLKSRLSSLNLDTSFVEPVKVTEIEKATMKEQIGEMIGGFLPYIFVIFCFVGAMYPAIDLAAGEKERATIETLLTSPASRLQIVIGKFLVVVLAGLTSAIVSILGIFLSIKGAAGIPQEAIGQILRLLETKSIIMVLSLLLPLCVFLAAALLSLSIYAKSFKEAQSIIAPMNIVVILPVAVGMVPGIKLTVATALIPILNVSLAAKDIISGTIKMELLGLTYLSLFVLAAISLVFCAYWFKREDVIFRGI